MGFVAMALTPRVDGVDDDDDDADDDGNGDGDEEDVPHRFSSGWLVGWLYTMEVAAHRYVYVERVGLPAHTFPYFSQ